MQLLSTKLEVPKGALSHFSCQKIIANWAEEGTSNRLVSERPDFEQSYTHKMVPKLLFTEEFEYILLIPPYIIDCYVLYEKLIAVYISGTYVSSRCALLYVEWKMHTIFTF